MYPTNTEPKFSFNEVLDDPKIRMQFLCNLPLFKDVQEDICKEIVESSSHVYRDAGEITLKQGDPPGFAHIILRGVLQVKHPSKTNSLVTLYYLPYRVPGEPGGLNNLICHDTHNYTVHAVTPTDLLLFDPVKFLSCFERSPVLARNIISYLKYSLADSCDRLGRIAALKTKEARVVGELLEIALALRARVVTHPKDNPNRIVIDWLRREPFTEKLGISKSRLDTALQLLTTNNINSKSCIPFIVRNTNTGTITIERKNVERLQTLYSYLTNQSIADAIEFMIDHRQ